MSAVNITRFHCDRCGAQAEAEIMREYWDTGLSPAKTPRGWTAYAGRPGDKHLCPACTERAFEKDENTAQRDDALKAMAAFGEEHPTS